MKSLKIHLIALIVSTIFAIATTIGFLEFSIIMREKQNRVKEVKEQLAIYKGNKEIFEEETKELKNLLDRATKLETYLVTTSRLPAFLSSIEKMAKENNIDFNITSAQNSGKSGTEKLTINFTAKSTLKSIDEFLEEFSHQPYQINFLRFYLFSESDSTQTTEPNTIDTKKVVPKKTGPTIWELTASIEVVSFVI